VGSRLGTALTNITRLSDQTRHLAVLVNDLHILAQAEAKQLPLIKSKIDVAALV